MYYTVVGNGASTVVLDLAGDNLSAAVTNGTKLQIIPFDTLGSVFPNGASIVASPSHSLAQRQTEILIPDQQTPGLNLAASTSYYYYSGSTGVGPGWRKAGATGVLANDDVLYPDTFFIVRTKAGQASNLTLLGAVQMGTLRVPVNTLAANVGQDNAVALPVPSTLTLHQTGLFESGAFVGSPSHSLAQRQDELLVWDNSVIGHDKAATLSYYYYTGTTGAGPGWRLAGDSATKRDDTDTVINRNLGVVVRKKGTSSPGTVFWVVVPPYVAP
jgi:uncharacterized protein (TIGR02597 family)